MQEYAHYFLPSLSLFLAGLWFLVYTSSPSIRAKQWLNISSLAGLPVFAISLLWWPWNIANALSPAGYHVVFIAIIVSLCIGLITTLVRRLLEPSFNQVIKFSWWRFSMSLVIFLLIGQVSAYLPWPREVSLIAALLSLIAYCLALDFSLKRLYSHLATAVLSLSVLLIVHSLAYFFDSSLSGLGWQIIQIGADVWDIAALIVVVVAWPILIKWWTRQAPKS